MTEAAPDDPSAREPRPSGPRRPRLPRPAAVRIRCRRPFSRLPRWWPVVLCTLLGTLAGAAYGLLRTPQYTATGYVAVVPEKGTDPGTALGFAQAYGRIATGSAVLAEAQSAAGLPVPDLRSRVTAVTSPDAPLVEITGSGPDAKRTAVSANAVARSLVRVAGDTARQTGVRLTVFSPARAPSAPSSSPAGLTAAVGGCAGGLAGGLFLLVRPRRQIRTTVPGVPAPATGEASDRTEKDGAGMRDGDRMQDGDRVSDGDRVRGGDRVTDDDDRTGDDDRTKEAAR